GPTLSDSGQSLSDIDVALGALSPQWGCQEHCATGESMIDSQVIAFMCVAAMLTLTPGADTMLVVRNVLRGGRQDGIVTTCGICTGLFVHATLSALGVSVILLHSATAFHLVKYAGACYLVWLGIPSLWSAVRGIAPPPETMPCVTPDAIVQQHCFREGLLS